MSEKDESITQKWLELAETVARKYLSLEHEDVLRLFGIDPDEELPDNDILTTRHQAEDCRNDRIYWIEINSGIFQGTRCAAWRTGRDPDYPWIADLAPLYKSSELSHEAFTDSVVTVVYEIIPEE